MMIFQFFLIILVSSFLEVEVMSQTQAPPAQIAIHLDRDQLLQDALSWLTLRSNGDLLQESQITPLVDSLRSKYRFSKFYRSFVIAFQLGVLPKLILNEGQSCDPSYPDYFKDPYNSSVTWYLQKNFTLNNYYDSIGKYQGPPSFPSGYCDYRQGLVCLSGTSTCGCPEGSRMESIGGGGSTTDQRCLLDDNEVCPILDLRGQPPSKQLIDALPHLIFRLERPLACKQGYHCGYKPGDKIPRCYPSDPGGSPQIQRFEYGDECVLDLISNSGGDGTCGDSGGFPLRCYNYWGYLPERPLPASGIISKRIGYCASEFSPFITEMIPDFDDELAVPQMEPFVRAFVNPRTTPLRGSDLRDYDGRVFEITDYYLQSRRTEAEGSACGVKQTNELVNLWTFYSDLEKVPPTGQDYGATETELNTKLDGYEGLIGTPATGQEYPKICQVIWKVVEKNDGSVEHTFPYSCVGTGQAPDRYKHDGTCQKLNDNGTLSFAEQVKGYFEYYNQAKKAMEREEVDVDQDILKENPEAECVPKGGGVGGGGGVFGRRMDYPDVLEGGNCPEGYVCFEDLSDSNGIYVDLTTCKIDGTKQIRYVCHDEKGPAAGLGTCERQVIGEKIRKVFGELKRLGQGETCKYPEDGEIRRKIVGGDLENVSYMELIGLEEMRGNGEGICDAGKLLECGNEGMCRCLEDCGRRRHNDGGVDYFSDYCYLKTDSCKKDVIGLVPLTENEKHEVMEHYGENSRIQEDCSNGNVCVFINSGSGECTTDKTDQTGVDTVTKATTTSRPLLPPPPPPPVIIPARPPSQGGRPEGNIARYRPYHGGAGSVFFGGILYQISKQIGVMLVVIELTYLFLY